MAQVTKHAKKRIRQRGGVSRRRAEKAVGRAWSHGIKHSETTGELNAWISKIYFKHMSANNVRLYGGMAYIFSGETLITAYPIPEELWKDGKYIEPDAYGSYVSYQIAKKRKESRKLAPWEVFEEIDTGKVSSSTEISEYSEQIADPETLRHYLATINGFALSHNEDRLFRATEISQDSPEVIKVEYVSSDFTNDFAHFGYIEDWFRASYKVRLCLYRKNSP